MTAILQRSIRYFLLIATWIAGSLAVTACFITTWHLLEGKSLRKLVITMWQWPYKLTEITQWLVISAGSMAVIGLLCMYARRRGHKKYHYFSAFLLGLTGYWIFWTIPSWLLAYTADHPPSFLVQFFAAWILAGIMGALLNAANLLFVVPAFIFVWYRILNGPLPAAEPDSWRQRRKAVMLACVLAVIGLITYREMRLARQDRPVTAVQFDLGQRLDDTIENSGIFRFETGSVDGQQSATSSNFDIPADAPVTYTRKGYEIRWTDVYSVEFQADEWSARNPVRKVILKHSIIQHSNESPALYQGCLTLTHL